MVNKDSYISRTDKAAFRMIDHEVAIAMSGTNKLYVLNTTGSKIWEMAEGQIKVDEIAEAIHETYDVTHEQALMDVIQFIEELSQRELLLVKE